MIQKQIDPFIWKDFKQKTQNIDILVEWAIQRQNQRISDKYSNISNTVKIMKNLMAQFIKKADNLQKNLLASTRISQIQMQSKYHQQRIIKCQELSQKVRGEIQQKNRKIGQKVRQANNLKKTLMKLKTQNIKLFMRMQEIQKNNQVQQQKQNIRQQKYKRIAKIQQDRKMITNTFNNTNYLQLQSNKVEVQLFNKIDKTKKLRQFIEDCFRLFRQKLKKKEKKSNMYGLAGSMLFKMQTKQQPLFPQITKPTDSKLLVYDILKQKYKRYTKNQNKKKQSLVIQEEQFMNFTPMQVIGVIQLKGGLNNIINKKYASNSYAKDSIKCSN